MGSYAVLGGLHEYQSDSVGSLLHLYSNTPQCPILIIKGLHDDQSDSVGSVLYYTTMPY